MANHTRIPDEMANRLTFGSNSLNNHGYDSGEYLIGNLALANHPRIPDEMANCTSFYISDILRHPRPIQSHQHITNELLRSSSRRQIFLDHQPHTTGETNVNLSKVKQEQRMELHLEHSPAISK